MNDDHVAVRPEYSQGWVFVVPSRATDCSKQVGELLDICEALFDGFENFVTPLDVQYVENVHPRERVAESPEDSHSEFDVTRHSLSAEEGLQLSDVRNAFEESVSQGHCITEVQFDRVEVTLRLSSGEETVDRDDGVVEYKGSREMNRPAKTDPISVRVSYHRNRSDDDVDSDFVFDVRVETKSRIWFGDDGTSSTNGPRLHGLLSEIESTLPVAKVVRDTDYDNADHMSALF